jgi:ribosomal protein S18 acetylase RimI-like enzyme
MSGTMTGSQGAAPVRIAGTTDVPDLAAVQLASALDGFAHIFPEWIPKPTQPELEMQWAALVADPEMTALVALHDNTIVASVAFGESSTIVAQGYGHLAKLYVLPDHAGEGLGRQLHDIAVEEMRSAGYRHLWLWVLEGNTRARGMYERRGWVAQAARRTDYPGSGVVEMGYLLEL